MTDDHGRGLHLVGALADRWGTRRRRETDTKTVWFELTYAATVAVPGGRAGEGERPT